MRLALLALLVAAAPLAAQTAAEKEPPRRPLNLNLDDAMRSQPVINFGPAPAEKRDKQAEKQAESGLPSLGSDARRIEAGPATSSETRRPFPKDSEMQNR